VLGYLEQNVFTVEFYNNLGYTQKQIVVDKKSILSEHK